MSKDTNLAWIADRGLLDTVTDPNNLTVNFDYDNFNRTTRELRPDGAATRWSFGACVSPSYCGESTLRHYVAEALHNPADAVAADRVVYFDAFDREKYDEPLSLSGARAVTHTVYDAVGRVSTRSVPFISGSSDPYKIVTFTYDLLNRLKKAEREVKEGDSTLQSTQWTYDGFTVSQTDALGRIITAKYSAIGQVLQLIDAAGTDTDYEYDAFGSLVKTRDISNNEITIEYNIRGFKTKLTDPDLGSNWTYDYFPLGELKLQTDAKGQSVTFDPYDPLGRPTVRHDPEGDTYFGYGASDPDNNIGRLTSVSSPGHSESFFFDSAGRLDQTGVVADGSTYYVDQSYDYNTGFLGTITYPTSTSGTRFKVKYGYVNGHLKTIHDYTGDVLSTKLWEAISANARGRVFDEELGNGLKNVSKYDHITGWLVDRESGPKMGSLTAVQNLTYAWDKVGNLTQRQDLNQSLTEGFTYDNLNRLTTVTGPVAMTIGYDAIGNITSKTGVGSYAYGHATKKHAVTSAGGVSYGYDANGNMNSRNGASITWYSFNLPNRIDQSGGNYSQFWYGADRQRYKQVNVEGGTTTTTIYVAGGLFEKVTVGAATDFRHYVMGPAGAVAIQVRSSGGANPLYYPLRDHLGSLDRITNSSGAVVVALSFDAFGKRRGTNWTGNPSVGDWSAIPTVTRRGFTEHEHLDNLSLIHMNGRVYDPVLGRFLSADPYVPNPLNGQSFNRFSYVNNNPLSLTDPSGFTPDTPAPPPPRPPTGIPTDIPCARGIAPCAPRPPRPDMTPPIYRASTPSDAGVACVPHATPGINGQEASPSCTSQRTWEDARKDSDAVLADLEESLRQSDEMFARHERERAEVESYDPVAEMVDDVTFIAGWTPWGRPVRGTYVLSSFGRSAAARGTTTVIGRTSDLKNLAAGERSLLDRLTPDLGSPKANWARNSGVLREEMKRGLPIRDASPGNTGGTFLNAERALLTERGWTFNSQTGYWMPPGP